MHDETRMIRTFALETNLLLALCALSACHRSAQELPLLEIDPGGREPRLLAATLAQGAGLEGACRGERVLVMVFSHKLDPASLSPKSFALSSGDAGKSTTPTCVSLEPSNDPRERRTVFATGVGEGSIERVEVIGSLETAPESWGRLSLEGSEASVEAMGDAPALVFGERIMVADSSCLASMAHQAVRLTWSAPVAPSLEETSPAHFSVTIMNHDGTLERITPTGVMDDDGDNHHELCLESYGLPLEVRADFGASRVDVLY